MIVQRLKMIRIVAASRKIEHEPLAFEAVYVVAIFVAYAGEICIRSVCLRIGLTGTLEIYSGGLM